MVTTTDTPDGERLARVETRLENLETLVGDLRNDLREFRAETHENLRESRVETQEDLRAFRAETQEDLREFRAETQENLREFRVETQENLREFRVETRENLRDIRNRMDKQFLWILGVMFTMWISLFVLIATLMIAIINKLS